MTRRKTYRTAGRSRRKKTGRPPRRAKSSRSPRALFLLVLVALLLFLGVVFLSGNRSLVTLYVISQKRNHLMKERDQLRAENSRLRQRIHELQENLRAIEEVAREQYNLKKPNEEVFDVRPR